jgi:hypothetical protein
MPEKGLGDVQCMHQQRQTFLSVLIKKELSPGGERYQIFKPFQSTQTFALRVGREKCVADVLICGQRIEAIGSKEESSIVSMPNMKPN